MAFDPTRLDRPIFSALLTPHRSLGRTGFLVLMGVLAGISFLAGVAFVVMGAWPVFGFFGLDVLLVYWAFRINFQQARAREEITITPLELVVRRTSHRGQVNEWRYNPLWVRLDLDRHEEFGAERLTLVSRGKRLSIAAFLGPEEKESFAHALRNAIQAAKRGPNYNPIT